MRIKSSINALERKRADWMWCAMDEGLAMMIA